MSTRQQFPFHISPIPVKMCRMVSDEAYGLTSPNDIMDGMENGCSKLMKRRRLIGTQGRCETTGLSKRPQHSEEFSNDSNVSQTGT